MHIRSYTFTWFQILSHFVWRLVCILPLHIPLLTKQCCWRCWWTLVREEISFSVHGKPSQHRLTMQDISFMSLSLHAICVPQFHIVTYISSSVYIWDVVHVTLLPVSHCNKNFSLLRFPCLYPPPSFYCCQQGNPELHPELYLLSGMLFSNVNLSLSCPPLSLNSALS